MSKHQLLMLISLHFSIIVLSRVVRNRRWLWHIFAWSIALEWACLLSIEYEGRISMKRKHIFWILVIVFLVGVYGVAMSAEVTNVVVRPGWAPDAQGGPTGKTVGQTGDRSRGGYSRDLFFVGFDDPGQWVEWNMNIPEAGQYRLIIRYSTHEAPKFVRRNFKLRLASENEAAYIDNI